MQPDNTAPNAPSNQPSEPSLPQPNPAPIPQPASGPVPGEPGTIVGTLQPAPQQSPLPSLPKKPKFKKSFVIAGVVAALVILGGVAAAFYVTSANDPGKLWETALDNTNKGYDRLVAYNNEQSKTDGGTLKGTYNINANNIVADGTIDSKFDAKNSSTKVDLGVSGTRFSAEVLSTIPEGAKNPDLYVKVSGVKGLDTLLGASAPGLGSALSSFDNQWLVVDHTIFDQAMQTGGQSAGLAELSDEDIQAAVETFGRVNKEYIFTNNSSKAVLTVKQNVGKEKRDNRDVYHYKVGYNKANLKNYVTTLKDEIDKTKLKGLLASDEEFNRLKSNVDKLDENGQADVWVDTKTKLMRAVRFTDSKNQANFVEVGLNYNGGDEYPFVLATESKDQTSEVKAALTTTLNTKSNTITFDGNIEGKENSQPIKMGIKATLTPSSEALTFEKPAGAKSLLEVYSQLLGGLPAGGAQPAMGTEL